MTISKITKFALVGLVTGMITGLAGADTNTDLQERLVNAEARIAELSASTDSNWLNDQRSEEIRDLVHDVLADADSRASMVGNGSPVTVNVHGFLQFRWDYNHNATDGVDNTHGFSVPHTRLELSGDVYSWNYKVSGQWDDGAAFNLLDVYAEKSGFRFGQFKSPFLKEVLTNQEDTLAVDRSVIAQQFGQGRSQGVQYGYNFGNNLRFTGAYTDGFNTANGAGVVNGYSLVGRVDYTGAFADLGFAVAHNNLDTSSYTTWTADSSVSVGAVDFTGAYVSTSGDTVGDNWGTVWTANYNVRNDLGVFATYEYGELENVTDALSIASVGVNYYINPNMKWTSDVSKSFNAIDGAWNLGTTGWTSTTSENEILVRTQFTVTF